MPRLFFGLELPTMHRTQLSLIQSGVRGMRWIEPSDFHITLCFLGDISNHSANDVLETVSQKTFDAPTLGFTQLQTFGSKKPTSLYLGVANSPELTALHAGLATKMRRLGLEPDVRRFTPHVTLGRCSAVKPADLAAFLSQHGLLGLKPYEAQRFVLYSARDSIGGGPYHVEAYWPLKPSEKAGQTIETTAREA